jgi:Tol biopolymer transport system component
MPTLLPSMTPPAGLVYRAADGLWLVDANNQPRLLFDDPYSTLLPNGRGVFYGQDEHLWYLNLASGETRNLSQTAGDWGCCPHWSASQPDSVFFLAGTGDPEIAEVVYWGSASLTAEGYELLFPIEYFNNSIALSPDGQTLVYATGASNWLRQAEGEPQPILLEEYGLVPHEYNFYLDSPVWSPDGRQLAWMASSNTADGYVIQVALMNLETKAAQLLHPYTPPGRDGYPPEPVWSPDGEWLALTDVSWEEGPAGGPRWLQVPLWVMRTDGSGEEIALYGDPLLANPATGWEVAWSPDGRWLAFSTYASMNEYPAVWIAEVGTWEVRRVDLPGAGDVEVAGWIIP